VQTSGGAEVVAIMIMIMVRHRRKCFRPSEHKRRGGVGVFWGCSGFL
jgi:hypothetical protein